MEIEFYKYQGTGNDFIVIDGRTITSSFFGPQLVQDLCDRKFGIGADGLMVLKQKNGFDFEMLYFNANGLPGSMCGNGGRCMVAFARFLNLLKTPKAFFLAVDGAHQASINILNNVSLKMKDVSVVAYNPALIFIDTGSPHHIEFIPDLEGYDVYNIGKSIRNNNRYRKAGTNVNFVQILGDNSLKVATYERGVEDETLSCGTGVTAAAIAYYKYADIVQKSVQVDIQTKGGKLAVSFNCSDNLCTDIWLSGPTKQVYKGYINLP